MNHLNDLKFARRWKQRPILKSDNFLEEDSEWLINILTKGFHFLSPDHTQYPVVAA